jgi:hypothetical protein
MKPEKLAEKNSQITTSKVLIRKYKISLNDDKVLLTIERCWIKKYLFIFRLMIFLFGKLAKDIFIYFCYMDRDHLRKYGKILVTVLLKLC